MTAADKEGRTSMLAKLTAEVMADKKAAAGGRTLTPVEGEVAPAKPELPMDLPGAFMAHEDLVEHRNSLRRFAGEMLNIANGIDIIIGTPEAVAKFDEDKAKLDQKLAEKEADRRAAEPDFNANFRAQQAAVQAKVFKPTDAYEDSTAAEEGDGWACPIHGKATEKTSPKTGRKFIGCPDCNLFKR